jgi:hypothetical protein
MQERYREARAARPARVARRTPQKAGQAEQALPAGMKDIGLVNPIGAAEGPALTALSKRAVVARGPRQEPSPFPSSSRVREGLVGRKLAGAGGERHRHRDRLLRVRIRQAVGSELLLEGALQVERRS